MSCDAQALADSINCLQATIWPQLGEAVEIVLLCAILDGTPMSSCDPQYLIEQAKCIYATIPPGAMQAVKLSLLCQIAGGGSSGGTQVYIGRDPLPPDDVTKAALNYPAGGGTLTQWDVGSATWV